MLSASAGCQAGPVWPSFSEAAPVYSHTPEADEDILKMYFKISKSRYKIINIGNNDRELLLELIEATEEASDIGLNFLARYIGYDFIPKY